MQRNSSVRSAIEFAGALGEVGRKYWVMGVIALAAIIVVLAMAGVGRTVESWTASSTIQIGTLPTFDAVMNSSASTVVPIEGARSLVMRIASPEFQSAVASAARQEVGSRPIAVQGVVRGVVLDDAIIRLEVAAPSKEAAVVMLHQAVLRIQNIHRELSEPRIQLLKEVRDGLKSAVDLLSESLKEGGASAIQSLTGLGAIADTTAGNSRNQLDRLVIYRTRIAVLNFIERTLAATEPQGGFVPTLEGPREVNLVQRALIAGLGLFLIAAFVTFLLHARSRRA